MEGTNYDWMKVLDAEELRKIRRKYWTFVVWPELEDYDMKSDADRWKFRKKLSDQLGQMVIPSLISPIHDRDVKEDGTIAKPHCHVISLWESPIRYNLVLSIIQNGSGLVNVKYVQPVANLRAMMRYLIHLDNPEKQQYDPTEVISVSGAEYVLEDETASQRVISYILDNRCDRMTKLLLHFDYSPSCTRWIISNPGLVKSLCKEQVDMVRKDYQAMQMMAANREDEL